MHVRLISLQSQNKNNPSTFLDGHTRLAPPTCGTAFSTALQFCPGGSDGRMAAPDSRLAPRADRAGGSRRPDMPVLLLLPPPPLCGATAGPNHRSRALAPGAAPAPPLAGGEAGAVAAPGAAWGREARCCSIMRSKSGRRRSMRRRSSSRLGAQRMQRTPEGRARAMTS